jgi:hypothetical protein
MYLYMQHKTQHGHATWTFSMGIQHGDMDKKHGYGHAAWTQTCSMDMDMQHGDMEMQHVHALKNTAWTWTCSIYMSPLTLTAPITDHCRLQADWFLMYCWTYIYTSIYWAIIVKFFRLKR